MLSVAMCFVTYMSFLANRATTETDATKSDRVMDIRSEATTGTSTAQVLHTTNPAQISPNPPEVPRTKGGNCLVPHKERSKDQRYQRSSRNYQEQKTSDPTMVVPGSGLRLLYTPKENTVVFGRLSWVGKVHRAPGCYQEDTGAGAGTAPVPGETLCPTLPQTLQHKLTEETPPTGNKGI